MNWLPFRPHDPGPGVDSRFVPLSLDSALREAPPLRVQPREVQRAEPGGPACVLVSDDENLVAQCALISLGAAVRISRCSSSSPMIHDAEGPVLWGADALGEALAGSARCDVLVGHDEQAQTLWEAASRLPLSRVAILPGASQWLGEYLGLWCMRSGHGHTVALGSRAGGVGTSTLAVLLAHAGTLSGLHSLVVDLDPHSCGLWPRICARPPTGIRWDELAGSGGALASHQLVETLPTVRGTAVLTWSGTPPRAAVDGALTARLLTAARQGFDLLVLDTGRTPHPGSEAIGHFTDRQITVCDASSIPPRGDYVLRADHRMPTAAMESRSLLGKLSHTTSIERAVDRGDLLDALRSRRLRQQLADLRLLPVAEDAGSRGAP
ncbi:hypothetical protein RF641_13510 [Arthrobacter sp. LS16]|uniref:hypothetical protein n=1 Tax=Arthrobacter sp. 'calajunan' TaxID=1690248 RepID=UPI003C75EC50